MNSIDRRAMKVLLAALDLEQQELAAQVGYNKGYVVNVLNGFTKASPGFRRALGDTIVTLLLGPYEESVKESYPPEPLVKLVKARASDAPNKRDFYRDLGTSPLAMKNRKSLDGAFVDRICCALGVHPTSVYGFDYDQEAS